MDDFNVVAVYVITTLFVSIIMGVMTRLLARLKGYRGCFWIGFFLNIIGLIYVAGLPISKELRKKEMREIIRGIDNILDND